MVEKTEYRLNEYREYENGTWGPWFKIDHRIFDDDSSSVGLSTTREEQLYSEWLFGKIDSKYAWKEIKKEKAVIFKLKNMDSVNKPENKHILDHYNLKIQKIEEYLKVIEERIRNEQAKEKDKKTNVADTGEETEQNGDELKNQQCNNVQRTIKELQDSLQLKHDMINGKYCPTNNEKAFVRWIVDNNYDDVLTPGNYFSFIHSKVKEETVKKYFREARDIKNK